MTTSPSYLVLLKTSSIVSAILYHSFSTSLAISMLAWQPIAGTIDLPWKDEISADVSKDWVETCDTHMVKVKLAFPGCISKSIISYACKGTCYSRSEGKWKPELENTAMVQHCMCCKPMTPRFRLVTLDCPSRGKPKSLLVSAAMDCRCRPCSDAQPELEQPYDY